MILWRRLFRTFCSSSTSNTANNDNCDNDKQLLQNVLNNLRHRIITPSSFKPSLRPKNLCDITTTLITLRQSLHTFTYTTTYCKCPSCNNGKTTHNSPPTTSTIEYK